MNETLRTFLDASELSHNGPLLLGAVKTAGGRGGEGREEREGKVGGRRRAKFREGMLIAR